ncbi:MAG: hypothetical protein H8E44_28475 [Planctomycetes bacterium]|nr:hypothetical protein [Planctomycetota bacterium]
MLKISGTRALEAYGKKLAKLPEQWPKAQASACNAAGAAYRQRVLGEVKVRSGLPAQPVGRRVFLMRADARKGKRLWAKVTGYQRKFSASYHKGRKKGGAGTLMAIQTKSGATVGGRLFAGSWISKNKRGRKFVGKRTGRTPEPFVTPSVDLGPIIGAAVKRNESKALSQLERELSRQVDVRLAKHMGGF